ncbi:MAG: hypothetical protein JWP88_1833 [Flaviaesturariibacter sp.]|nr:hypothetical protein [Flaviaesturariibacter sp.]
MRQWIGLVLFGWTVPALAQAQGSIMVRLENFRNDKGVCRVCLFNSDESFKRNLAVKCAVVSIKQHRTEARFDGVAPGTYALFVIHDENNNDRMDTNFFGIPKEGYGASLNRLPFAAAPTFEANKFIVPDKAVVELKIKLRNL